MCFSLFRASAVRDARASAPQNYYEDCFPKKEHKNDGEVKKRRNISRDIITRKDRRRRWVVHRGGRGLTRKREVARAGTCGLVMLF